MEALWTVILTRLSLSFLILKSPFWGIVLTLLVDYWDFSFLSHFSPQLLDNYQATDKILDLFYLTLAAIVASTWPDKIVRRTAVLLFVYRMIGTLLFEISGQRVFLFIFPNLFEFFFLYYTFTLAYLKNMKSLTRQNLATILIILLVPKLIQEYYLHLANTQPWGIELLRLIIQAFSHILTCILQFSATN